MKLEVRLNSTLFLARTLPDGDFSFTIGCKTTCDIRLPPTGGVSRNHATLSRVGESLVLTDVGSTNGTFNGTERLLGPMVFAPGDDVRIGVCHLSVCEEEKLASVAELPVESNPPNALSQVPQSKPSGSAEIPQQTSDSAGKVQEKSPFEDEFKNAKVLYTTECMKLKHELHGQILTAMNLTEDALKGRADEALLQKLEECVDLVLRKSRHHLPTTVSVADFRTALMDELVGLGPISPMLRSDKISEIMVNGPDCIFVESKGLLHETGVRFFDERHLVQIIQRIVEPLGRHIDDASPMVDARLEDGSRVNAVIHPLSLDGASLTIRKFSKNKLTTDDLIRFGSMTKEMAMFLEEAVRSRQNILVSGGTGSGKTTLLNVLSQFIPQGERVVTVEDSAELKLSHRNIVRLEARPPNIEGKGRISIRDLVINCLRMRPDRIIVGECRGAEALDMLQAMNTGHDGSLTTAHANNPRDALARLENMVMMAGFELPSSAIREQIASAINLIVQQTRLPDGSRKVVKITEVTGRESNVILLQDIFTFEQEGLDANKRVVGHHTATGNIPYFIDNLRKSGDLRIDMSVFVPRT